MCLLITHVSASYTVKAGSQKNARSCAALRRHASTLTATQPNARIDSNPIPAFPRVALSVRSKIFAQIRYFRHSRNLTRRNARPLRRFVNRPLDHRCIKYCNLIGQLEVNNCDSHLHDFDSHLHDFDSHLRLHVLRHTIYSAYTECLSCLRSLQDRNSFISNF